MKTLAFSRALARAVLQFRKCVEAADEGGANVAYATALGLIAGATLSGGISKAKGQEFLVTLKETRAALLSTFGSAPESYDDLLANCE